MIERFCRIISAMMQAGVPLPEAMQAAIEGATTRSTRTRSTVARERCSRVRAWPGRSPPRRCSRRPRSRCSASARTPARSTSSSTPPPTSTPRELDYKLKQLTALVEPAIIIVMGVIVGFVAVALVSAMYGIFNSQKARA